MESATSDRGSYDRSTAPLSLSTSDTPCSQYYSRPLISGFPNLRRAWHSQTPKRRWTTDFPTQSRRRSFDSDSSLLTGYLSSQNTDSPLGCAVLSPYASRPGTRTRRGSRRMFLSEDTTSQSVDDNSKGQDLASLAAVQLLGSCLTMPPEIFRHDYAQNLLTDSEGRPSKPQMISTLALQTRHCRIPKASEFNRPNDSPTSPSDKESDGRRTTASPVARILETRRQGTRTPEPRKKHWFGRGLKRPQPRRSRHVSGIQSPTGINEAEHRPSEEGPSSFVLSFRPQGDTPLRQSLDTESCPDFGEWDEDSGQSEGRQESPEFRGRSRNRTPPELHPLRSLNYRIRSLGQRFRSSSPKVTSEVIDTCDWEYWQRRRAFYDAFSKRMTTDHLHDCTSLTRCVDDACIEASKPVAMPNVKISHPESDRPSSAPDGHARRGRRSELVSNATSFVPPNTPLTESEASSTRSSVAPTPLQSSGVTTPFPPANTPVSGRHTPSPDASAQSISSKFGRPKMSSRSHLSEVQTLEDDGKQASASPDRPGKLRRVASERPSDSDSKTYSPGLTSFPPLDEDTTHRAQTAYEELRQWGQPEDAASAMSRLNELINEAITQAVADHRIPPSAVPSPPQASSPGTRCDVSSTLSGHTTEFKLKGHGACGFWQSPILGFSGNPVSGESASRRKSLGGCLPGTGLFPPVEQVLENRRKSAPGKQLEIVQTHAIKCRPAKWSLSQGEPGDSDPFCPSPPGEHEMKRKQSGSSQAGSSRKSSNGRVVVKDVKPSDDHSQESSHDIAPRKNSLLDIWELLRMGKIIKR
ncbi:hypothetical protein QBC46DRAFT_448742 [Diplogelasinospora grovesii]|uniref:Uncharacterized protein n=1 Tax=Diplogelasinospora grovesii TaxID=303347 RepID=A0AAN6NAP4_9PEZI|nr:hypothetical protein QBC46DRAFT_448742 [Diplogelasinospora grovesii]